MSNLLKVYPHFVTILRLKSQFYVAKRPQELYRVTQKNTIHSGLQLKSVIQVRFNIFTGVLEL